MAVKLDSLDADPERDGKGEWQDSEIVPGVRFKVSSLYLPAYMTASQIAVNRLRRQYKGKPVPPDVMGTENGKLLADHILHEWSGFDIPYDKAEARRRLSSPRGRLLRQAVEAAAAAVGEPDIEYTEEAEKN